MKVKFGILALAVTMMAFGSYADIIAREGYWSDGQSNYGYGKPSWDAMSTMLDAASGGTMFPADNLENTNLVSNANALWIDLGRPLSSTEAINIKNFIATGKRVVMFGEWIVREEWNNQIMDLVGGIAFPYSSSFDTPALVHELTDGVNSIAIGGGGRALGGTKLFSEDSASLYGPFDNVLAIMDVNMFAYQYIENVDNTVFAQNVAHWIATIPEPSTFSLIGIFGGVIFFRRFFRAGSMHLSTKQILQGHSH